MTTESADDIAKIAKDLLDLWQEYLAGLANRPDLMAEQARWLLALSGGALADAGFPNFRATPSPAAPQPGLGAMGEHGSVVAALEKRLAAVEEQLAERNGGASRPSAAGARKRARGGAAKRRTPKARPVS
ncbi:MAG TPA: hypothetical protein VHL08_10900 [Dongiaceae bacterium]|jgi:hypothetical protein|nr:hypothetical protein [Dongiaceae bacterium]